MDLKSVAMNRRIDQMIDATRAGRQHGKPSTRMLLRVNCWRTQQRSGGRKKVPSRKCVETWLVERVLAEVLSEVILSNN